MENVPIIGKRHPDPVWITPAGIVAAAALVSALISVGWNYRSLSYTEAEITTMKGDLRKLEDKQERVIVLEVKLDGAIRTLDKISLQLEEQRLKRPAP